MADPTTDDCSPLRLAAMLENARDTLHRLLGDGYEAQIEPWRELVRAVSDATRKTPLASAMAIIVEDRLLGSSTQWRILAAAADVAQERIAS